MKTRFGELEALDSVQEVLNGYDAAADRWNFSFDSPFWKAVRHAHSQGKRGLGQRIALIDSGCDLNFPRLRQRVDKTQGFMPGSDEEDRIKHGTAVALLISDVAPDSRLDVYRVTFEDGRVDLAATVKAINAAAKSDATVINLSLGDVKPLQAHEGPEPGPWTDPDNFKRDFCKEEPPCHVCQAAAEAAKAGKLVFAAVGNSIIDVYCPARVENVVAVGFQRQERLVPAEGKEVTFGLPVLEEAPYADLFVPVVPGVLGSSFACPLYAGVGALGVTQRELAQYISSLGESVFPKLWHSQIDTTMGGPQKAPSDFANEVEKRYKKAVRKLPHAHCSLQTQLRPDLPLTDPSECAFYGFFAEPLYVKAGLWLAQTSRYKDAIQLLEVAQAIAPWSAEASAYLGMTFHAQGDSAQAIANYERALQLRPDDPRVLECLRRL